MKDIILCENREDVVVGALSTSIYVRNEICLDIAFVLISSSSRNVNV